MASASTANALSAPPEAASPLAATGHAACRPMTVEDLDAVMAIEVQSYSHPWSRGNFIDSLAAGHLSGLVPASPATAITDAAADEGECPLGYFVAMVAVDELHLLNITVAPRHRGRGHGRALLEVVVAAALARGLHSVWLEVRASNERARQLYQRQGFNTVGQRRGYYPAATGREDALVMVRRLGQAADSAGGLPAASDQEPR